MNANLRSRRLHAQLIISGDIVAVPQSDGSYIHLSAMYEASKHPLQLPSPRIQVSETESEEVPPDELEILSLISQGLSQREVAKRCGTNQSRVQKVVVKWKEQHHMV